MNPLLAFVVGLAIVLLASILNAAGLNLTKLDHVRTSAVPKAQRKKDWMRPLWLLGMLLYILSQLIGSTLALEYMRAEYVAPLGSTSLVFNFLFARFLVGTPVTTNDIYGTIVVILGVVGIVAFGSINSGLTNDTDVAHITYLWRRGGWLGYFFLMSFALCLVLRFTTRLDFILAARSDLAAVPFSAARLPQPSNLPPPVSLPVGTQRRFYTSSIWRIFVAFKHYYEATIDWITDRLEIWAAPKDDKQLAWTLGIGWACCGGGLAGGCLVFAKATVKLLSGSLSHENPGNQFGHAAPIFTIILLFITSVLQIICLNRGLKVYDSTLVVPVFYGVYTATGWLDSLIFNDEVEAYKSWTLFLISVSIFILIAGVVLLTHKKPEPLTGRVKSTAHPRRKQRNRDKKRGKSNGNDHPPEGSVTDVDPDEEQRAEEDQVLWTLGDDDDEGEYDGEDEDVDHHQHPLHHALLSGPVDGVGGSIQRPAKSLVDEQAHLMEDEEILEFGKFSSRKDADERRRSMDPFRDEHQLDDFTLRSSSNHPGRLQL